MVYSAGIRKSKRADYRIAIILHSQSSHKEFRARIINISEQGLCFESSENIPLGDTFIMQFHFFSFAPLKVIGGIVWKKRGGVISNYGVHFEKVGFFTRLKMRRALYTNFSIKSK